MQRSNDVQAKRLSTVIKQHEPMLRNMHGEKIMNGRTFFLHQIELDDPHQTTAADPSADQILTPLQLLFSTQIEPICEQPLHRDLLLSAHICRNLSHAVEHP